MTDETQNPAPEGEDKKDEDEKDEPQHPGEPVTAPSEA